MKKFFSVFLVFLFVFTSFAFADTESELIGTWVGSSEFYYGEVTTFLLRLYDDHFALYQTNNAKLYESDPFSIVSNAKWELKEDGVHVYYRNYWDNSKKEEIIFELTQAHFLAYKLVNSYVMLVKLPDRQEPGTFHTVSEWE